MRGGLQLLLGVLTLLVSGSALAGTQDYLFRDALKCDAGKTFCFRGTMSYDPNPRLLRLRARVRAAPGPGMLRITLTGANALGHRRIVPFEVRLRGTHSEIINHKMIPDNPDVQSWVIDRVEFVADPPR